MKCFKTQLIICWNKTGESFHANYSRLYSNMSNGVTKDVYLYSSCNETCQKPLHKSMRENILQPPVSSMMASIRGIGDENRCLLADNPVIRVQMKRPILFRNNSNWWCETWSRWVIFFVTSFADLCFGELFLESAVHLWRLVLCQCWPLQSSRCSNKAAQWVVKATGVDSLHSVLGMQ